jgi:hypothetical protein
MTYIKVCLLMLMILLVAGCATKDPLQPTDVKRDIMPLAVGVNWTYDLYLYSPPSPVPVDTLAYIVQITGQTTINQEVWYNARHILRQPGYSDDTTFWYYTLRDSGLCVRISQATPVRLKVKAPGTVGTTFTGYNEFMANYFWGDITLPGEIQSTSAAITVPKGSYSCYFSRLDYESGSLYFDEYYAYNVGMVRSEMRVFDVDTYYDYLRFELVSFSGP